ncbi:MAG: serine hydrolase [Clostridia bacterium]|nr:serine hydrolase [Clostridia bacterium]
MDKWQKRSVDLFFSLFTNGADDPSVVPYYPQKTEVSGEEERYFKRSSADLHGISSSRIYNMLSELEHESRANIHTLLVLKDGEVISECSRKGYSTGTFHLSHSMSKTVTGMAVGLLFDDGLLSLSDRLVDLFPEIPYKDRRFPGITVEHLLSMQSGISFSELGSVTETKWTEAFFSSYLRFSPGTDFRYNSMNSYMLSVICERVSGEPFISLVERRLFSPLHITNYFWEKGPEGVEKGGWGLYLSAESWAKLGYMVLSGGAFEGKRILSEEWISASVRPHALSPMSNGDFNYAYQMWVGRSSNEILFNGMLGQNVWICPRNNIVAVITSGNNELFQVSASLDILRKYLGAEIRDLPSRNKERVKRELEGRFFDSRRWVRPLRRKRGLAYLLRLRSKEAFDIRWNGMLRTLVLPKNNVSLLPFIVCGMQNNFSAGIERITLERVGESLIMSVTEGGCVYTFEIGLYGYSETVLDFRGERYIVKAMGEAYLGKSGRIEYKLELVFPELPNTRMIRLEEQDDGSALVSFCEMPDGEVVTDIISRIPGKKGVTSFAVDLIRRGGGERFMEYKLKNIFSPTMCCYDADNAELADLIEQEEKRILEVGRTEKIIRAICFGFGR